MPQQFLGQRQDLTPSYMRAEQDQQRIDMQREQITKALEEDAWSRAFKEQQFKNKLAADAFDREMEQIRLEKGLEQQEWERDEAEEKKEWERDEAEERKEFREKELALKEKTQERLLTQNERLQTRLWYLDRNVSPDAKKTFAESDDGKRILEDVFQGAIPPIDRYEKPKELTEEDLELIRSQAEAAEDQLPWYSKSPFGESELERKRREAVEARVAPYERKYREQFKGTVGERMEEKERVKTKKESEYKVGDKQKGNSGQVYEVFAITNGKPEFRLVKGEK